MLHVPLLGVVEAGPITHALSVSLSTSLSHLYPGTEYWVAKNDGWERGEWVQLFREEKNKNVRERREH